jgi:signal transduction histidine kinase
VAARTDPQTDWAGPLLGGGLALLAAVAGTGWFLGRAVVRPLAAVGRAATGIAHGDLDTPLPASRVREVAEVTTALDRTAASLRAALERQADVDQQRRLFVSAIAHDLRTPLFTLRAHLDGLADGLATTPEKTSRYVATCRAKTRELDRLVADLFSYARVELLDQAPRRDPLDLGALLRAAADDVRLRAADRDIAVTLTGPDQATPLTGDEHLLTRAIGNVLDNALRHTPPHGHVDLRWQRERDQLRVEITNTGAGIAPDDLPHLFTPLYRGETSRNRATGGAGLGLAVARRILRAHHGDLTAANTPDGHARLTATLPSPAVDPGA